MSKTLLDSEGLKLYDRLIKEYIANNAGGGGGGSSDGIPKVGDRGVLAGFNTLNSLFDPTETVIINALANDDTFIMVSGGEVNVTFEAGGEETFCKQVLIFNQGGTVTLNIPTTGDVIFDNASLDYSTGVVDLLVYVWYGMVGIVYTKNIM